MLRSQHTALLRDPSLFQLRADGIVGSLCWIPGPVPVGVVSGSKSPQPLGWKVYETLYIISHLLCILYYIVYSCYMHTILYTICSISIYRLYIYIYTWIYTYMHIYICICIQIHICIYIYTCNYRCVFEPASLNRMSNM